MSEEKKEESITEKKLSRRSMLKWTGALAGAAIVGGAAVYGATYKAPPPPPPSFKPPLSPDVQTTVDGIVQDLINRHTGETTKYGGCTSNCAGQSCLFKYRTKNGVLTAIEPDDTDHPNIGREDRAMTQQDFDWAQFQRRGCPMGYAMLDHLNSPDRLLYPMQRAPGTPRGGQVWTRISWDQAISTIANNLQQVKAQYGPFSVFHGFEGDGGLAALGAAYGVGVTGMGACSDDVGRLTGPFSGLTSFAFVVAPGNDLPDELKYSKLIICSGMTHATTHYSSAGFSAVWYRRMCREKGIPTIYIDPKYTQDAEVWADQWIPIKPGTDTALYMAMAYVIITEGLYDAAWTDKYMYGFQPQADYILGKGGKGVADYDPTYAQYDTIPKTPEWAEAICGIPAATIKAMAELYAKTKPAVLLRHFGVSRKSYGEYCLKMAIFLGIITANAPYVQGGFASNGTQLRSYPITQGAITHDPTTYNVPTFYRAMHWARSVELAFNVQRGGPSIQNPGQKMTWQEWAILAGYNADPAFVTMFNPRYMWAGNGGEVVTSGNVNANIRVMTDPQIVGSHHNHTRINATGRYCDIVLPLTDGNFESGNWQTAQYSSFDSETFENQVLPIPGEVKYLDAFCCNLLNKLGGQAMARKYWNGYNGDDTFVADYNADKAKRWQAQGMAWLASHGVANPPTWDQLIKGDKGHGLTQWHDGQFTPNIDTYASQPVYGRIIDTKTGKYEHVWDDVTGYYQNGKPTTTNTRGKEHFDFKGRKYAHLPNDWKDIQPISVYRPAYRLFEDFPSCSGSSPLSKKYYPLVLHALHSKYRSHSCFGDPGDPRLIQCWRHSVVISPTDAKPRGIKDNDICRVYNEIAQVLIPAHVTNRIMPGLIQIREGIKPVFVDGIGGTPQSMDSALLGGGCGNDFTENDDVSPITPSKVMTSAQIEKYADGTVY